MNKFKCEKCSHETSEKGFCPKDGSELKEIQLSDDQKLDAVLGKIGNLVKERVEQSMKDFGLDKGPSQKIFQNGKASGTRQEKIEYVKSILSPLDKASLDSMSDEKDQSKFLTKARIAYFFKNLIAFQSTKDPDYLQHVKALAEGTDGVGGYLTPREFRAELIQDIQDLPFLRNFVTVIPMSSDFLELPTLTSDVKTSWGSENTTISTTTARFGTLSFTPYRLNTMLYTSRELVADSAINVIQLITRLFVQAIGREEDRVIINGSGSGQPKGILQETLAGIDNANVDADLPDNIQRLPFRIGTAYRRNARWILNSLSLANIRTLKDTTNNYLFREGIEGGAPSRLAGYPLHEQNDMPLDTLLFGDLSFYYLADREQISVETTTEGAGTFEKHQVAIKVVERLDGKVAQTAAFRTITNSGID